MLKEFKEFAIKGNAFDLAVGVIIGAAFGKIVDSLVNDIIMPPLGYLLGNVDFSNLYVTLSGDGGGTLAEAEAAGAVTLNYGQFVNVLISFLLIAFVVFMLVKQMSKLKKEPSAAADTKSCQFCQSAIHLAANRCPHCTSQLPS